MSDAHFIARLLLLAWLFVGAYTDMTMSKPFEANYDENRVTPYTLPDSLVAADGTPVKTAEQWIRQRRPEILRLFETHVYGRAPSQKAQMEFRRNSEDRDALGGKAIRKQVTITISSPAGHVPLHLLLYLPKSNKPVPAFLGLNFSGNQAVHTDSGIEISKSWVLKGKESGIVDHRATETSRGIEASRWQVEQVVARGYAVATMCCGDIDPDIDDGFRNGVHPLFYRAGQTVPDADEWGTIAAWAWGLSRVLDYLETDSGVDAKRVAVWGHSRLGKTSLWAAACDERFALAISNNSGCGGAALSRRIFGETVGRINTRFPHWFCRNFRKYNNNEAQLPIDQHMLIALVAPRPVYVASAAEDRWADPRGEFLSAKHAEPIYRLFGRAGLKASDMPPVDRPVGETIGYHIRTGKHDATAYDWLQYLSFADRHLKAKDERPVTDR